jgi:hypothetical protein
LIGGRCVHFLFIFFFLEELFSHWFDRWGIIEVISQLVPNK